MTQCDICGQEGITLRYISRSYGKDDNLLVIENIPMLKLSPLWRKLSNGSNAP